VVVRLGVVHPLDVLVREVAEQREDGEAKRLQPEDRAGVQPRHEPVVLGRDADHGRDGGVAGDEDPPDDHAARDGHDVVLGPVVGHQCRLAQHGEQDGRVHGRAPDPVARYLAVALDQVAQPEELAADVQDDGVVNGVGDPRRERLDAEEGVVLPDAVELRVAVE